MKYWGITYDQALWGMSYQNLIMLNLSIPKYDKDGNKIEAPSIATGKDFLSRINNRSKK